jgi:uncharacterized membrane protein
MENLLNKFQMKNWHQSDQESRSVGDRLADNVAEGMGSWRFIIIQTIIVIAWMVLNVIGLMSHWDPYPFILLNLLFLPKQRMTPIIMMAQNRQADRDRAQAQADYETNVAAKKEIEELQERLARIENEKLDEILKLLKK